MKVISVGAKYRVTRSAIFEALGLDPATATPPRPAVGSAAMIGKISPHGGSLESRVWY